jgi:hypothetical protein
MKPFVWREGMSPEEAKDGAYWERNMLALLLAKELNEKVEGGFVVGGQRVVVAGWYPHQGEPWEGWSRVISLYHGRVTFHVPDDFDLGGLPQIEPNWDGHSTEEKWKYVMEECGVTWET